MDEFIPFRFKVTLFTEELSKAGREILCGGYFSEVTGLEFNMEPKAIQEGGRNWGELQRMGQTKFSTIVLKRGVTDIKDLWSWFDTTSRGNNYGYRMRGEIEVKGSGNWESGKTIMTWVIRNAIPVKFKGPDLSSTASQVAVEELHLAHEGLELKTVKKKGKA